MHLRICDFMVELELPVLAVAVLLLLGRFNAWWLLEGFWYSSQFLFLHFLFVLLTGLSLWVVSKKSRHLGFCVDWARQLQSALCKLGMAYLGAPGWWLMRWGEGKMSPPKKAPPIGFGQARHLTSFTWFCVIIKFMCIKRSCFCETVYFVNKDIATLRLSSFRCLCCVLKDNCVSSTFNSTKPRLTTRRLEK